MHDGANKAASSERASGLPRLAVLLIAACGASPGAAAQAKLFAHDAPTSALLFDLGFDGESWSSPGGGASNAFDAWGVGDSGNGGTTVDVDTSKVGIARQHLTDYMKSDKLRKALADRKARIDAIHKGGK